MHRKVWLILGILVAASLGVLAAESTRDISKGSTEERLDALASIQPGLGTVMIEYGNRFTDIYFAATGGNWGLAQYQLKEALEIQEVGEITRPARAPMLKAFEDSYLNPLSKSIEQQNLAQFKQRFNTAIEGCNACHTANGYAFIRYSLPKAPVEAYLRFNLKTKPVYQENKEPSK